MPTPAPREAPVTPLAGSLADPAVVVDAAGGLVERNAAAASAGLGVAPDEPSPIALDLLDGGRLLVWPAVATVGDEEIARQKARILEHLAPGVAHDLVNQVGGIQSFLQVVEGNDERDRQLLDATAARAMDTVRRFQDLVRTRRLGPANVDPSGLVAAALALAEHPLADVDVTIDVPGDLPGVTGDPSDLRQALLAVVVNALDALGWPAARGTLRVQGRPTDETVEISIEDDGATIPAAAAARLFDPRPPPDVGRAPLDLAVARHLLRGVGGDLRADIGEERSNRFVLELPVTGPGSAAEDPAAPAAADTAPETGRPSPTPDVLVCDDDASIRALIVRVLRRDGLHAVGVATGEAALAAIAEEPLRVVIADDRVGSMSGLDLYRHAVDVRPELRARFVLVSGDAADAGLLAFAHDHGLHVVEKPFDVHDLAALVREVAAS